jgi:hypothetical protein
MNDISIFSSRNESGKGIAICLVVYLLKLTLFIAMTSLVDGLPMMINHDASLSLG